MAAETYQFAMPAEGQLWSVHFIALFFSGEWLETILEGGLMVTLTLIAFLLPSSLVDVPQSMPFSAFVFYVIVTSIFTRMYNAYLEACFFAFPQYRTQPGHETDMKASKDVAGRDRQQFEAISWHDRITLVSQIALKVFLYYSLPGYYPPISAPRVAWYARVLRLVVNHYVLAWGMYWAHRAFHTVPFFWKNIHSMHHYAKHPVGRVTYQDHWLENFLLELLGHVSAQIVVPLDHELFWFSHVWRIMESLEKHSGISCWFNIAHHLQLLWVPGAQMPHHHDWHHEGHKGSNFSFTSIGGAYDCLFGSRNKGRALSCAQGTAHDRTRSHSLNRFWDQMPLCFCPNILMLACVGARLWKFDCAITPF